MSSYQPIGVFDSGYGGLTILKEIVAILPQYDYVYLGDNARAPYGPRSFHTVYRYTLECVEWFFQQGCPIVIIACNTASAKALRTIQQNDLHKINPQARVLGVIRPCTEIIGNYTTTGNIGILATSGTVKSNSYIIEIQKFFPDIRVYQEACPMWVPLIENDEHTAPGVDYFIKKHLENMFKQSVAIDTLLLACTHYPLLEDKIKEYLPANVLLLSQGKIIADSLANYLKRHPEIELRLSKQGEYQFFTTDSTADFDNHASTFFGQPVKSAYLDMF
ncbi:MAG: glutamate racemase [Chitinophagaceae bacterium]